MANNSQTGISIDGLDEVQEAFQRMLKDFPAERLDLMDQVGDILIEHIKPLVPIDFKNENIERTPGELKASIKKKVKNGYVVVKSTDRIAHLIEAGHVIRNKKNGNVYGFVKGNWMFKKGTAIASIDIKQRVNSFAKKVTDK